MTSTSNDDLWTVICDDDFTRTDYACDVYQDRYIVIAGGFKRQSTTTSAVMYDVKKQSYLALPDLPYAAHCHGVVLNDYFYMSHGDFDIYRICLSRRLKWERVDRRMARVIVRGMVTDGNQIFLIDDQNQITIFDPINGYLRHTIDIPEMSGNFACVTVLIDNKIYIMQDENMVLYHIDNRSWSPAPPPPEGLNGYPVVVVIDRWIVVTRENIHNRHNVTFAYDTHTHIWTKVNAAVSSPRAWHKYVKVGSHIIALGGKNYNNDYGNMTSIYIKHIIPEFAWIMLKPFILLRQLIDDNRAAPIIATKKPKYNNSAMNISTNANAVVEKLFTNMPLGVFRHILMFLK